MSLVTAGCATPPAAPQPAGPPLVLESFLTGQSDGEGAFINSWTGSRRHFRVEMAGTWDGETLQLVEDFAFDDGQRDRKTWRLRRTGPGTYEGTRDDVVGIARAWSENGVVRLAYAVRLGDWTVDFADVLALRPDGSLLNVAIVSKWFVRVGRVQLTLVKRPA